MRGGWAGVGSVEDRDFCWRGHYETRDVVRFSSLVQPGFDTRSVACVYTSTDRWMDVAFGSRRITIVVGGRQVELPSDEPTLKAEKPPPRIMREKADNLMPIQNEDGNGEEVEKSGRAREMGVGSTFGMMTPEVGRKGGKGQRVVGAESALHWSRGGCSALSGH